MATRKMYLRQLEIIKEMKQATKKYRYLDKKDLIREGDEVKGQDGVYASVSTSMIGTTRSGNTVRRKRNIIAL